MRNNFYKSEDIPTCKGKDIEENNNDYQLKDICQGIDNLSKSELKEYIKKQFKYIEHLGQELADYVKIVDDLHIELSEKCDWCFKEKNKIKDMPTFKVKTIEKNSKSETYAIVVKNREKFNSYFGLSFSEFELLCKCLNNLKFDYDTYLFLEEKRNNNGR